MLDKKKIYFIPTLKKLICTLPGFHTFKQKINFTTSPGKISQKKA